MPPVEDWLFATTWVHVFEEDAAEGDVYRPEGGPVPLSRRPRRRFALRADGSAVLYAPGPDDRFVEQPATWAAEGDELIVRAPAARPRFRIVARSPQRLVVATTSEP